MSKTLSDPKSVLTFGNILPGVFGLLPRIPSIAGHLRKALSIKGGDSISLGLILEENARKFPDNKALLYEDQEYTHHSFNALINQYANYFINLGIQPGDVVVVFVENRPELLLLIAACAKIGAIASLINPNQRAQVLQHSINLDKGKYFVVGEELIAAFESERAALGLSADTKLFWMKDKGKEKCPADYINIQEAIFPFSKDNPDTTQKIQARQRYANVFTSGTTGLPKASVQTHRKWLLTYYWFGKVNLNLNSNDVMYVPIPFFHTNALIVAWPAAASAGAAVAMRRKFSVSNFWKDVQKFNVSTFIYIGEVCRYIYNAPVSDLEKKHRIKKIIGNGLRPDIWKGFKERFNIQHIFEFYGAADGNISFTNTLNIDNCVGWCTGKYAIVKYNVEEGEPIRNKDGFFEKVYKGEAGLLVAAIDEKLPFDGYVNKENNSKKIFEDVFEKGDRWFNSGDLMRDIGFRHAQFVDRVGDTFRWKGENVATAEVEGVVNGFPLVERCSVYGIKLPHADGRAGMLALTAEAEPENFDLIGLADQLKKELPAYAVPLFIRFCKNIETTATHKIKRYRLQNEGLDITDPVYVLLPKTKYYVPVDKSIHEGIKQGIYSF